MFDVKKYSPFLRCLVLLAGMAGKPAKANAQSFQLCVQPMLSREKIVLGKTLYFDQHDSLMISTFRCYLGHFECWKNGQVVTADQAYHLLDLEDESSLCLRFDWPYDTAPDSLGFRIGVDSLTTASGVMGGDLDPTKGMFWSWQSGYINLKLEGVSSKCPARKGGFEFHLGAYSSSFRVFNRGRASNKERLNDILIDLDLAPFFHSVNWGKKTNIMSPCPEAIQLMKILSNAFSEHEK
jgi:hypothetical protein